MPRTPKPRTPPKRPTRPTPGPGKPAPARAGKADVAVVAARRAVVRGSRTGRPIMALLDLLGRRWVLRILWELRAHRLTFRGLREACDDVSPTVLNQRLRELREAGFIEHGDGEGYGLSALGLELFERFSPIVEWAERWAKAAR
ncbi:MAG: helix-turn-helix transcriptional regulator [Deltaproteobacteria bacterium]|nr:helix-turn-helix transcriptional regulator [Deltaproteobacteria bacterium]